jgi:DNA-binding transcriptional MerR regulator
MSEHNIKVQLPPIPAKRYFTIGEVSELCGVKPHVLRYWEQEFTQLKPVKRRGNRRYYQHHEVLLIRRIRELLYEQGFTISGARNRLDGPNEAEIKADNGQSTTQLDLSLSSSTANSSKDFDFASVKAELLEILNLLRPSLLA